MRWRHWNYSVTCLRPLRKIHASISPKLLRFTSSLSLSASLRRRCAQQKKARNLAHGSSWRVPRWDKRAPITTWVMSSNFKRQRKHLGKFTRKRATFGGEARALHDLGTVLYEHGDLAGAQKNQQEALDTCRKIGNQRCVSDALNSIGIAFKDQMDFTNARQAYEQSVAIRRETGDRIGEAVSLNNIAVLLYQQGKFAAARKLYEQSLAITQEIGEKRGIARALTKFGDCVSRAGPARGVQQVAGTIHRYPPRDWR